MNNFPYHESVDLDSKNSNINIDLDSLHHRQSTHLDRPKLDSLHHRQSTHLAVLRLKLD